MTDLASRYPMLASLDGPAPLHDMDDAALAALAEEMRQAIIATVSTTGGHLGSSLGTIELSIALHAELDSPRDRILWDVGHQAYGHKLLTGRRRLRFRLRVLMVVRLVLGAPALLLTMPPLGQRRGRVGAGDSRYAARIPGHRLCLHTGYRQGGVTS